MKPRFLPFLISCALLAPALSAAPVIQKDDVVAICGDSITAQREYSVYIEEYLLMCQPALSIKALQCGWGGSTAGSLASHLGHDVMTLSPTAATVCLGMNDGNYNALDQDPSLAANYRSGLEKLIAIFRQGNTRTIIIGTPGIVDSTFFRNPKHANITAAQYNQSLGQLGRIAKEVAASKGVLFADLHTPMMEAMEKSKGQLGARFAFAGNGDGVHGGPPEHLVMAYAFLKAMGFDGTIGAITYDDAAGTATATDGHRIVSSQPGKVVIESSRYPFCFFHGSLDADPQSSAPDFTGSWGNGTVAILPFVPFNQDLNRYTLIVQNLKSPKARITWGEQSKLFTAAELAQGINLAAEFLKNPFVQPFAAATKVIAAKQDFESQFITQFLCNKPALLAEAPSKADAIKAIDGGYRDIHSTLLDDCQKAVKPVTHTIRIEDVSN